MLLLHAYLDHKRGNNIRLSKGITVQVAYRVKRASYSSCWEYTKLYVFTFGLQLYQDLQKTYSQMQSQKKNLKILINIQVLVT